MVKRGLIFGWNKGCGYRDLPPTLQCLPSSARCKHCLCGYSNNSSCNCTHLRPWAYACVCVHVRAYTMCWLFLGLGRETLHSCGRDVGNFASRFLPVGSATFSRGQQPVKGFLKILSVQFKAQPRSPECFYNLNVALSCTYELIRLCLVLKGKTLDTYVFGFFTVMMKDSF